MAIVEIIIYLCLVIGVVFNSLGVIGLLRFPDLYTRMHATTKATTFGSIFTSLAVVVYGLSMFFSQNGSQYLNLAIHAFLAAAFLAFTNAVSAHAIARAAYRSGIRPTPAVVNRLEEAKL
ncbi:MAG: monovalent cation/H(+) antiporter subunit G [Methanoregula sp.]|jgi:multicomponent Na+:H+ antiporter subunit G|nr:monovalent cation/H(+) antiporter subunit G [Methanoregula sp.]